MASQRGPGALQGLSSADRVGARRIGREPPDLGRHELGTACDALAVADLAELECELVGAGLLLWPSTVFFGAALMGMICVGAFFAQLFMLHGDTIHTVVLAGIFAAICWNQRNRFSSLELSATVR